MQMKTDLENRPEAPAPLGSRRQFIRTAAITGGAGLLSAPIRAQESAKKASVLVLPAATKDVTPFKVHVPQAALCKRDSPLLAGRQRNP
jgi:hypothetical protein